uniref:NADH-ubiquinone oxidoreductase chain 1 n=1 Tax=Cylindrus obtusus TaxID=649475 RepID=I1T1X0_9EUPU|nr:NADH dehydrogenase subunit 1 [Cylindrus obtusus]AEK48350.1 NADH dehydrogenase subunit 1 [Cylindrus obtusus]
MLCVLLGVAYMTLLERKILSYVQTRKGPNKVGLGGLFQPLADALKLFLKEQLLIYASNVSIFLLLPLLGLVLNLAMWGILPSWYNTNYVTFNLLLFLCLSSLNVYIVFGAGWASNSLYAFLGGMRASAQTISYEICFVFLLFTPLMFTYTATLTGFLSVFPLFSLFGFCFLLWFATCLAETNRAPFDFAEGESELVSGFNIEYGGGPFAFLFLAEYTAIMLLSMLTSVCFLVSTTTIFFIISTLLIISCFLFIRGVYPRYRYDKLMLMCWKSFLPLSMSFLSLVGLVLLI